MKYCLIVVFVLLLTKVKATEYYISSSTGSDNNIGTSKASPWASISRLNKEVIKPGDKIFFKSGDRFTGSLRFTATATEKSPLLISTYLGDGYAHIDGDGDSAVIHLKNPAYITLERLELTNWKGRYGILYEAESAGELKNVVMQDLEVHHVGSQSFTLTEPEKNLGAICGKVRKGNTPSWFNGLTIQRANIYNVGSCGINLFGEVSLYQTPKSSPYYKPHKNVLVQHCRIDSIVRDGLILRQCDGAIVQHCKVSQTGLNAVSNGLWFADCLNSIIQFNEGWECFTPQGNDGAPFSIDNHSWNCVLQYNYSHDNEGPGYMMFGKMGDNGGNIIRNNLSYNDNTYKTKKTGTACITVSSEVKDALIENNIIIAGPYTHYILGHRNWEGYPHSVTYRNNLFVGNGKAIISEQEQVLKAGTFHNNLFLNIPNVSEKLANKQSFINYFKQVQEAYETINKGRKTK